MILEELSCNKGIGGAWLSYSMVMNDIQCFEYNIHFKGGLTILATFLTILVTILTLLETILKGILSWSANFLYVKELFLLSSETYFLSQSEVSFPLKFSKH